MKNLAMVLSLVLGLAPLGHAANVGDAEEVNLKIYQMWASASTDCSNPQEVFSVTSPTYKDFTSSPDLGTGNLGNGTYVCVAIRMSDVINFTPAYNSDDGNCVQGTQSSINVFRSGESSTCPDGTVYAGSAGEDTPCVYFSTGGLDVPEDSGESPFEAPGFKLQNAWVISADTVGTFVSDFTGKITDQGGDCDAQPPEWDFR